MCGAGFDFFAIKYNGDVIPCNALLEHVCGNIYEDSIEEIFIESKVMTKLRNLRSSRVDDIPGCNDCKLNPICDGGCRADCYNLTGSWNSPHPNCPVLSNKIDKQWIL